MEKAKDCFCDDCPYPHEHASKNQYDPQTRRRGCFYGGWVPEGTPIVHIDWFATAREMAKMSTGKARKLAIGEKFDEALRLDGNPWVKS
jgi:hypothetical protein